MNGTEGEVHIAQVEHRAREITESQWSWKPSEERCSQGGSEDAGQKEEHR